MRCQFIQPVNENLIVSDFDLQSAMPISTVFFKEEFCLHSLYSCVYC